MLGTPRTTVVGVLNTFHQTGSTENVKKSGRRGILCKRGKTGWSRLVKISRDVTNSFNEGLDRPVSQRTLQHGLHLER